ncbi:DUF4301 family protein [Catalinimonas niigatensis]|uniref:DUF4301 family protein n=1 Tax=Catalinimonas niigatensis TaxID=1397264 RepID=UPI002666C2C9|nr:DUF4301 family protein [Catalinimonas niigatensis]WPP49594.1 DUF4301 family protein [Catalinimonas niigatensis]
MFSDQDLNHLKAYGAELDTIKQQIQQFEEGFPFLRIIKAATLNDGLLKIDEHLTEGYIHTYEKEGPRKRIIKFVPASGAASRMFKGLYSFMQSYSGSDEDYQKLTSDEKMKPMFNFFKHIENFAFYESLKEKYLQKHKIGLNEAILQRKYVSVLETLLDDDGLQYGSLPKGLLEFHAYTHTTRTPVEEHLVEGAHYCKNANNEVYIHFTVSPEHRQGFEQHIEEMKVSYEKEFGVTYYISFSEQKPSTDTIAVDMDNQPFRNEDGSLLLRPGGHGALIENLNDLDADMVFIKNIDNVVPDNIKESTYTHKKMLGGILLSYQETIFSYLHLIHESDDLSAEKIEEIRHFVENQLCTISPQVFSTMEDAEKVAYLFQKLDRPIRVCGMVKNEGEPGGGPFWAENSDGSTSLQIVESAQVDTQDAEQMEIFKNSTHFNPVDIVCSLKDFEGKKFDLRSFVDTQTGFISQKSKDGKELKALELPGLWNGSMSDWNTIFVEVPIVTFNPVKTVDDLLRKQHQA